MDKEIMSYKVYSHSFVGVSVSLTHCWEFKAVGSDCLLLSVTLQLLLFSELVQMSPDGQEIAKTAMSHSEQGLITVHLVLGPSLPSFIYCHMSSISTHSIHFTIPSELKLRSLRTVSKPSCDQEILHQ